MNRNLNLNLRYLERGRISTKRAEENDYLFIEDVDWLQERIDEYEKKLKKAITFLGSSNIWSAELTIYKERGDYSAAQERIALLCREAGDEENDVYTLYLYGVGAVDKAKVSKAKAVKELLRISKESTEMLLSELKREEESE